MSGWTKKRRGCSVIHTHPEAIEGRAIVVNYRGTIFNGQRFETLGAAKAAALAAKIRP